MRLLSDRTPRIVVIILPMRVLATYKPVGDYVYRRTLHDETKAMPNQGALR